MTRISLTSVSTKSWYQVKVVCWINKLVGSQRVTNCQRPLLSVSYFNSFWLFLVKMFVSENVSQMNRTPLQNPSDVKVTMTTATPVFLFLSIYFLLRLSTQLTAGVQNMYLQLFHVSLQQLCLFVYLKKEKEKSQFQRCLNRAVVVFFSFTSRSVCHLHDLLYVSVFLSNTLQFD